MSSTEPKPGSVVGIAAGYGLDGPGIESRWRRDFSAPVQTGPGAHTAACTMGTGSFPVVKSDWSVKLTPHPLLMPWSWKGRAIPLLPLWVVRPAQSLSACTRVTFTFLQSLKLLCISQRQRENKIIVHISVFRHKIGWVLSVRLRPLYSLKKRLERSISQLVRYTVPLFAFKEWGRPSDISIRIATVPLKSQTLHLASTVEDYCQFRRHWSVIPIYEYVAALVWLCLRMTNDKTEYPQIFKHDIQDPLEWSMSSSTTQKMHRSFKRNKYS